jgi:sec-independent protein translocase protein TatA
MIPHFSSTELIIVLVIVILLFGVGRIGKIAGEMGKGIREFRSGLSGKKETENTTQVSSGNEAPKE